MSQNRRRRRRKKGIPLLISYLIRGGGLLLAVLCVTALVRGSMFLVSFMAPEPDQSADSSDGLPPVPGADSSIPGGDPDPVPPPQVTVQVVIDAGHGGKDPGCSAGGAVEKDITLQLALLLQQKLEAAGITTLMTRTEDCDMTMARRVELANQAGALLFVSLHCNSFEEDERVTGLECYYWQSDAGLALARTITQQVNLAGVKTREVKTEEYVVLRDTGMPAVLIETGFLTNDADRERLTAPEEQSVLMDAVARAVKAALDRAAA